MNKKELREDVELQLEELLENRPNEVREPRRRRNRMKDIKKDALRGDQRLKWILLDEKVEELEKEREFEIEEDKVKLRLVRVEDELEVENLYRMLSQEELKERYDGYSVTQTKKIMNFGVSEEGNEWLDVGTRLEAKRRVWLVDIMEYEGVNVPDRLIGDLRVGLVSKELNLDNIEGNRYTLKEFKKEVRPYIEEDVYKVLIKDIENDIERRLKNRTRFSEREEAFNKLDEEDKKMVRRINRYGKRSKWYDKKYVYRNRSKLRDYLKKELERDGDFGLTHHKTDLFEETDWVY